MLRNHPLINWTGLILLLLVIVYTPFLVFRPYVNKNQVLGNKQEIESFTDQFTNQVKSVFTPTTNAENISLLGREILLFLDDPLAGWTMSESRVCVSAGKLQIRPRQKPKEDVIIVFDKKIVDLPKHEEELINTAAHRVLECLKTTQNNETAHDVRESRETRKKTLLKTLLQSERSP